MTLCPTCALTLSNISYVAFGSLISMKSGYQLGCTFSLIIFSVFVISFAQFLMALVVALMLNESLLPSTRPQTLFAFSVNCIISNHLGQCLKLLSFSFFVSVSQSLLDKWLDGIMEDREKSSGFERLLEVPISVSL